MYPRYRSGHKGRYIWAQNDPAALSTPAPLVWFTPEIVTEVLGKALHKVMTML